MTRDDSLQITGMVLSHWPTKKEWSKEEIDAYAHQIEDMDAELTTSAVIRAAREIAYRPHPAELRAFVRVEKKRLAPLVDPLPERKGEPVPHWVRRWACARILHAQFGKEKDERRFAEQGDHGDLTKELMPEGAWEDEAQSLSEGQFSEAFRQMVKGAAKEVKT